MSDAPTTPDTSPSKPKQEDVGLKEVKYSLLDLLREAEDERSASSMAKQIVDQTEIQKMISDKKKRKRRGHS